MPAIDYAKRAAQDALNIGKLIGKNTTFKINSKRISIYDGGKYKGWMPKQTYNTLRRNSSSRISTTTTRGQYKIKFNSTIFQKNVRIKVGKMTKPKIVEKRIFTYTRNQRIFVQQEFKNNKIPIKGTDSLQKTTKLIGKLKSAQIKSITISRPTP